MFSIEIDTSTMLRTLSDVEKVQFPFALATALNDTAFQDVRAGWRDEMPRVFDRPTGLTLNAVLVNRANKRQVPVPHADVYLRDEAVKGTPPARYLEHQVKGGTRKRKPFENLLIRAGVMGPNEYVVPGNSVTLDAFGNVPGKVVTTILADLQAIRDEADRSTPESRRRRERRRTRRGGVYFLSRGTGTPDARGRSQNLPRGIYERIRTGFGTAVRPVFLFVESVSYQRRFDAYGLAARLFHNGFPTRFTAAMNRAIASAARKAR